LSKNTGDKLVSSFNGTIKRCRDVEDLVWVGLSVPRKSLESWFDSFKLKSRTSVLRFGPEPTTIVLCIDSRLFLLLFFGIESWGVLCLGYIQGAFWRFTMLNSHEHWSGFQKYTARAKSSECVRSSKLSKFI